MILFNRPGTIKVALHCKWRFKCKSYTIFHYYSYTYKLTCKLLIVLHGNVVRFKNIIINLKKFLLLTLLHSSLNPDLVLFVTALGYTRCSKASKQKLPSDLLLSLIILKVCLITARKKVCLLHVVKSNALLRIASLQFNPPWVAFFPHKFWF